MAQDLADGRSSDKTGIDLVRFRAEHIALGERLDPSRIQPLLTCRIDAMTEREDRVVFVNDFIWSSARTVEPATKRVLWIGLCIRPLRLAR